MASWTAHLALFFDIVTTDICRIEQSVWKNHSGKTRCPAMLEIVAQPAPPQHYFGNKKWECGFQYREKLDHPAYSPDLAMWCSVWRPLSQLQLGSPIIPPVLLKITPATVEPNSIERHPGFSWEVEAAGAGRWVGSSNKWRVSGLELSHLPWFLDVKIISGKLKSFKLVHSLLIIDNLQLFKTRIHRHLQLLPSPQFPSSSSFHDGGANPGL